MPCIDAITPSWPKRGMSAALRCCACSMRHRRSFSAGWPERRFVDVEHLAVGAVADRVDGELHAVRRRRSAPSPRTLATGVVFRPVLPACRCTARAARRHASRARRRSVTLMAATVRCLSAVPTTLPRPGACARRSLLSRTITHRRMPSSPSLATCFSSVDGGEARAGVLERRHALRERFLRGQLDRAAGVGGALFRRPRRAARRPARCRSRSRRGLAQHADWPAGASLSISPPGGIAGLRGDAGRLHRLRVRRSPRGRWRARAAPGCSATPGSAPRGSGSPRRSAVGADVHFSWCQPRPRIQSPGFAAFAGVGDQRHDLRPSSSCPSGRSPSAPDRAR